MATIANLAVSLTARTGNFERGFKKAQTVAARFATDMGRHIRTVATYGAAITGVAATALSVMVKNQMAAIDSTSKLARVVGLTTEQLTGYQHAISLAGGDSEGFEKSVVRMNRTIQDAANGLSTAQRELEAVGLSVQDLAGLSTDERIKLLADRYNGIGDAAQRASFLMNVFGRSGQSMGNLFEQGAEGIRKAQQEAEELGLTFSAIDGRNVEQANDAIHRMQVALGSVAKTIAIAVAPYIQYAAERMLEFAKQGNVSGETVTNALESIVISISRVGKALDLVSIGFNGFSAGVKLIAGGIIEIIRVPISWIDKLLTKLGMTSDLVRDINGGMDAVSSAMFDSFQESASKIQDSFADLFASNETEAKIRRVFDQIRLQAVSAGEVMQSAFPQLDEDVEDVTPKKGAIGQEFDIRRMVVGAGLAPSDKSVSKQQGQTMIAALNQIARNTKPQALVV